MKTIREAFEKVKLDIYYLSENFLSLQREVKFLKGKLEELSFLEKKEFFQKEFILNIKPFLKEKESFLFIPKEIINYSTRNEGVQTNQTNIPTNEKSFKPLKDQILTISTGNKGVQTDRQTDQQTDILIEKSSYNFLEDFSTKKDLLQNEEENLLENTDKILDSLDSLKKELRLKFKRLTDQELMVFSTIYQLEEQNGYSDYKTLSRKLKLTESSIRDYIRRLLSKKIPIIKKKVNNKEITLFISPNLKKILPLNSLLRLINL